MQIKRKMFLFNLNSSLTLNVVQNYLIRMIIRIDHFVQISISILTIKWAILVRAETHFRDALSKIMPMPNCKGMPFALKDCDWSGIQKNNFIWEMEKCIFSSGLTSLFVPKKALKHNLLKCIINTVYLAQDWIEK